MKMKSCLESISAYLNKFNEKFIERKPRPLPPEDYDTYLKAHFLNKINTVKECGN